MHNVRSITYSGLLYSLACVQTVFKHTHRAEVRFMLIANLRCRQLSKRKILSLLQCRSFAMRVLI